MITLKQFIDEKIAIHCATKEISDKFLLFLKENGLEWSKSPSSGTQWVRYREHTCYDYGYISEERIEVYDGIDMCGLDYFSARGFTVLTPHDVIGFDKKGSDIDPDIWEKIFDGKD